MTKLNLNVQKQAFPDVSSAYNNLLGISSSSSESQNRYTNIPMSQLDEIDNQPFPINDEKVYQIADSIANIGIIEPIIAIKENDRYKILSGRHRFRACKLLGKTEIPCYIKDVSRETARYILIATNTDRNNEYAPSVYAKAYAEQAELMKKLGKKTLSAIADKSNTSYKQIYRYIRLNYLIDELLSMVDNGELAFMTGVELSYFDSENQRILFDYTTEKSKKLSIDSVKQLRKSYENEKLTFEALEDFFNPSLLKVKEAEKEIFQAQEKKAMFEPEEMESEQAEPEQTEPETTEPEEIKTETPEQQEQTETEPWTWRIKSQILGDRKVYDVYRLKNISEPMHEGNIEYPTMLDGIKFGYGFADRQQAEQLAEILNIYYKNGKG